MTQQPDVPPGGRETQGNEPGIDLGKPRAGGAQQPPPYPPPPGGGGWGAPPPQGGGWSTPPPPGGGWGAPPQGAPTGQPTGQPPYGGYPQGGGYPPPQQWQGTGGPVGQGGSRLSAADERTWAGAAHWSALLASLVVLAFLGPLVVLLLKGNDSPFVRRQAVESLNFQLTILIAAAISFALLFVVVGILLLPLVGLAWLVFTIIGAVKASSGEDYRYPFALRMVH